MTHSVTGCSTWSRVFISRNQNRPARLVVEELHRAGAHVADRLRRPPRAASYIALRTRSGRPGAGASSTTFWCRRCTEQSRSPSTETWPWGRRAPAPRRAARSRRTARRTRSRRRTPRPPPRTPARRRRPPRRAVRTTRMPRPPPPADALTSSGRSASVTAAGVQLGQHRHARVGHQLLGRDLGGHLLHRLRRRPHPGQPGGEHLPGEVGALGEEPVAGVYGVRAGVERGRDDEVAAQVGLGRRAPGQPHRDVGLAARTAARRPRRSAPRPSRCRGRGRSGRPGGRSRRGWRRAAASPGPRRWSSCRNHLAHILKTPKRSVPSIGAFSITDRQMPSTVRVSRGSITPSSYTIPDRKNGSDCSSTDCST